MKKALVLAALMISGTALAQTATHDDMSVNTDPMTTTTSDMSTTPDPMTTTTSDMSTTTTTMLDPTKTTAAVGSQVIQPSNANPETDARGIAVISAEAFVPTGFNNVSGAAVGGPVEASGADNNYPACSATVTDNCVQTYERGRGR